MFDKVTLKLNVDPLILGALKEDITSEDVSTNSVMPEPKLGEVELICKQDGIICGLQVFARTFELLDEDVEITFFAKDEKYLTSSAEKPPSGPIINAKSPEKPAILPVESS